MAASNITIGMIADPLRWEHWPLAQAMLEPAIAPSDQTLAEVEAELASGAMQLVAVLEGGDLAACVVVRSALTKRGEMLEICYCGGSGLDRVAVAAIDTLQAGARDAGMIGTRIIGRPGWERVFRSRGFRRTSVVLEAA